MKSIVSLIICFLLSNSAYTQEKRDDGGRIYISNFLKNPFEKEKSYPAIYIMTVHGMKKDFTTIGTSLTIRKFHNINCRLLLNRYLLNSKTIFEMGKGKLGADSVAYFSLAGKSEYYLLRYTCNLTFLGYFVSKTKINGACIKLLSRYNDQALFTLHFDHLSHANITQYDYVAGYNYTE